MLIQIMYFRMKFKDSETKGITKSFKLHNFELREELVMLSLGLLVWLTLIGYLQEMHNYSSPAVCNYDGDTGCPVTTSIFQDFIPEVIPSQKCDMNMGQILQLHTPIAVLVHV
jgi:hypothetical protein